MGYFLETTDDVIFLSLWEYYTYIVYYTTYSTCLMGYLDLVPWQVLAEPVLSRLAPLHQVLISSQELRARQPYILIWKSQSTSLT
jgi:hypothetical protein